MKFLVGDLVSKVRGDQAESRQCYAMSTIFHLEDVEIPSAFSNISHTLGELDPREKETEKRGGPVEELESIELDD